jgi:hypothetical protein
MANFCFPSPRLCPDAGSARAVAEYLAGYGEALADQCPELQPDE